VTYAALHETDGPAAEAHQYATSTVIWKCGKKVAAFKQKFGGILQFREGQL
jgi:hypothetical protein